MQGRGLPVTREALYEEVWSAPATIVSPRYGLSDAGLLKVCKRLQIPVPGRGYWARVQAGRSVRKPPLPALASGRRLGPTPLSPDEVALRARVQEAVLQTRESQPQISVPSDLVEPHALVREAASRLKQREGWDHPAGVRSAPKEVLNLQVTMNSLDRALRLMDTLLKALEPSGFTARVDEERGRPCWLAKARPCRSRSSNRSGARSTRRHAQSSRRATATTTFRARVSEASIRRSHNSTGLQRDG